MAVSGGRVDSPEPKYRVGFVIGAFLVSGAFALDALGLVFMLTGIGAIVTQILGVLGSIGFFILFFFLGAGFFQKKAIQKFGIAAIGSITEMIPFVNGISPTFTIETIALIHIMRKEDREKAIEEGKKVAQTAGVQMSAQQASQAVRARRVGNDNEMAQEQEAA